MLTGAVHANWRRDGRALMGRTLDMKLACRQWALAPATEPFAVTCVYNPVRKMPELFRVEALLGVAEGV